MFLHKKKKASFQSIAKEKTYLATKTFNLNGDQQRDVYNAYMMSERKLASLNNVKASKASIGNIQETKKKVQSELYAKLENVLTADQMKKLKSMEAEKLKMKK